MLSNMEPDSTESHSLLTQGNSLYTSSTSLGYYSTSHATNLEEAIDNFTFGQKSNNHLDITSSEFMEGTPLRAERYINSIENQKFKSTTNSTPFAYPIVSHGYECLPFDSSSRFSNKLSLSLATSEPSVIRNNRQLVSENTYSCSSGAHSLSFDSYEELQVFPPLLSRSRFVQAVQEILAEIAFHALENIGPMIYPSNGFSNDDLRNRVSKKNCLLNLLQAVDERYKQCMDEIHKVTSAFHAVTELDPNLHARFAFATISFVYKNLRERISSHILEMGSCLISEREEEREDESFETCFIQKQLALQQIVSKKDHHLWRPQRGLPESSVSVLRSWMFQNFLHPYPKDAEKHLLALKSGLTRNQVSNWFINARVRIWKPMIEEMYAEMNKRKARQSNAETAGNRRNQITCALRMEDLLGNDHG